MTTVEQITKILSDINSDLAKQWLHNDIIKMKLAISYDDWQNDTDDNLTLEEHIEYYLDNHSLMNS